MPTIGVPAEVKDGERRIVLDPAAVAYLTSSGLELRVQAGAGTSAGFGDGEYKEAGALIVPDASDAWTADVVCKVKEPQPAEFGFFRRDLRLFCYLHLAAEPELARALAASGVRAYAFETLTEDGGLPLLAPMSEIAGRAAAIIGAAQLAAGSGTLPGGAPGVPPARAVVVGLGAAGSMAARGLRGMDAEVTGVDIDLDRLRDAHLRGTVTATLAASRTYVGDAIAGADLVVGAALVPGAKAPTVVTSTMVAAMQPGSVIVDLAIDQGGCIASARPTTLSDPTYVVHEVVHYCVTNVPGQYPRTSSRALSAAVAPRIRDLALNPGSPRLAGALNIADGRVAHATVAAALSELTSP